MKPAGAEFVWQEMTTLFREVRRSIKGEELRWLITRERIFNTHNGHTVSRSFLRHPGVCVVVPFLTPEQILLMRQYRYAIDRDLWELPAGTLAGEEHHHRVVAVESAEACAARELKEETGYWAERMEKVTTCYSSPGMGDQQLHLFFAHQLIKGDQEPDLGEVIYEIRAFGFPEIQQMLAQGEIQDAKTLIGLFYALRQKSPFPSGETHQTEKD